MTSLASGALQKMIIDPNASSGGDVQYQLPVGETAVPLNPYLGRTIRLEFLNKITCIYCGRPTKRSFNNGYCYPCVIKLARCDICILKPELCHYHESDNPCREPEWGDTYCMHQHYVYLSYTSNLKVGITRANHLPSRWLDQGAVAALPIMSVATRQLSGFVENNLREFVSDRTSWQKMLKTSTLPDDINLAHDADKLLAQIEPQVKQLQGEHGINALQVVKDAKPSHFKYPIHKLGKIKSIKLDKKELLEGQLLGIKGQYLILDHAVINMRGHTSFHVSLSIT